jgi:hypothetical protein
MSKTWAKKKVRKKKVLLSIVDRSFWGYRIPFASEDKKHVVEVVVFKNADKVNESAMRMYTLGMLNMWGGGDGFLRKLRLALYVPVFVSGTFVRRLGHEKSLKFLHPSFEDWMSSNLSRTNKEARTEFIRMINFGWATKKR